MASARVVARQPAAPRGETYYELYHRAVAEGRPLLYWLGQPKRTLDGCLSHAASAFPGVTGPAVVIGVPRGGQLWKIAMLPGTPTDEQIRAVLAPPPPVIRICPGGFCPARP